MSYEGIWVVSASDHPQSEPDDRDAMPMFATYDRGVAFQRADLLAYEYGTRYGPWQRAGVFHHEEDDDWFRMGDDGTLQTIRNVPIR